jgi:hypothetical protein
MKLQLQTFNALVAGAAAAVQGSARQLLDLSVGSTLRAVLEANAAIGLWMQWLVLQVLRMTRAATSSGADLDSWMEDFSLARLPAVAAVGTVTFARFSPGVAALVPVGTAVRTGDGSQTFQVVADAASTAWSPAQNGYSLSAGVATVDVPVVATVAGAGGNVQANAVSLIVAALPGVDTVSNAAPFAAGRDAESDDSLRNRFSFFLDSRARATPVAVGYAIESVQQGLSYTLQENLAPDGSARPGCFVVTVDDGSGAPSAVLLAAVSGAVEAVRPLGASFCVRAPGVVAAQIALQIATATPTPHADAANAVAAAVGAWVDALPIGAMLPWSRVAQVAYAAHPAVTNVTGVLVNGGAADLSPGPGGVVKASTLVVT